MTCPSMNTEEPYQYLHPHVAQQYEALSYVSFTFLGVWVWDNLRSINIDYRIVSKVLAEKKITPLLVAYYISRLATLAMIITMIVVFAASVGHCQALLIAASECASIAVTSSAFLFLPRTAAIFHNSRRFIALLSVLWLALFTISMLPVFALSASTIGQTSRCIVTGVRPFGIPSIQTTSLAVFDTLVFLLTSFRLVSQTAFWNEPSDTNLFARYIRVFFTAKGLSHLSKALLRGNQKYYFATVGLNITSQVLVLVPKVPDEFRFVLFVPVISVQNMLACRVFSQTLLDIESVQEQRIEIQNQSPSRIQHDVVFAEALGTVVFNHNLDDDHHSLSRKRAGESSPHHESMTV
ncbi:hypothetical protein C8Q75DRAFT_807103 [Abortiporus biennis]|nr:hypothetical protein C8Q75DRAFT_807103 [Abortiporus biennis]